VITDLQRQRRQAFGAKVRELRKQQGFSQEGFADHAGLHRTYMGSIERGERNVSLDNIHLIADALKVNPGELLDR
jgi:transcriptional regulator with XRE-family HTH domain